MPKASEIDDIFAGKTSKLAPTSLSAPSNKPVNGTPVASHTGDAPKKKKKKKKAPAPAAVEEHGAVPASAPADTEDKPKKRLAETIIDPSNPQLAKKVKVIDDRPLSKAAGVAKMKSKRKTELDEDERAFRDSRGKEPRRKTEEGWNIYKEDELGISKTGGDTPLCPFDCDCCF